MDTVNATTSEKIKTAIDLCALLTAEHIAAVQSKAFEDVIPDFLSSETGKMLYDESTKLWWSSPLEIADMYIRERNTL